MKMHNEVDGLDWILQLQNTWITDYSFWSRTGAFLLSMVDVNIEFYFTLIQLIVLNVESKCNLNRNIVNHSQPYFQGPPSQLSLIFHTSY